MGEEIYLISQKSGYKKIIDLQICGITFPDKSYSIRRPKSPIACIEYIKSGSGTVNINGRTFTPSGGDSYFLHTGLDQHYYSDPKGPWEKVFINFAGPLAESLIDGYALTNRFYFPGLDLGADLQSIIEIAKNQTEDSYDEIILILNRIMLKMHHHIHHEKTGPAYEMKNYLDRHIEADFEIKKLCTLISRSESQTIKIFKNAYGTTPYNYLIEKRIKFAKNLILNTNLSVKEIAYRLHFADAYYFSNVFKKKTGISPSADRKSKSVPE